MNSKSFRTLHHRVVSTCLTVAVVLAFSGCSSLNPFKSSSASKNKPVKTVVNEERQFISMTQFGYVRLEPVEAGAQPNNHPYRITAQQLQPILAKLEIRELGSNEPIFNEEELKELTTPLAAALTQASSHQDVTFAVSGRHGQQATVPPRTVTSGRMFVKDGAINIIFNEIRGEFETHLRATGWIRPFVPGSRITPSQAAVIAVPGTSHAAGNRRDWLLLAENTIPPVPKSVAREESVAAAAPVTVPNTTVATPLETAPQSDVYYETIEKRLTVLKNLKDKGLITEQEYNEKRKEVLKNL